MSRGELIIDDNQVKPGASSSSGDWAGEYQQQYGGGLNWAGEFKEQYGGGLNWADQFVHDEVIINLVKQMQFLSLSLSLSLFVCLS